MPYTETGFEPRNLKEIENDIKAKMLRQEPFKNLDFDVNSVEQALVAYNSEVVYDMEQYHAQLQSLLNRATSSGIWLENQNPAVPRKAGESTKVKVSITVDRALTLATDFQVQDTSGNSFSLIQEQIFTVAETRECDFECTVFGKIQVPINTVNRILTTRTGVISVNNLVSGVAGKDYEDDATYKRRLDKSEAINKNGTIAGLEAGLLNLSGVVDVKTVANQEGFEYEQGKLWTIVDGGDEDDIATEISKRMIALFQGSIEKYVFSPKGEPQIIRFDRTNDKIIDFDFEIYQEVGVPTDISNLYSAIKEEIVSQFNVDLRAIFAPISASGLSAIATKAVAKILGNSNFTIISPQIRLTGTTPWLQRLAPNSYKDRFVIASSSITITTNYS